MTQAEYSKNESSHASVRSKQIANASNKQPKDNPEPYILLPTRFRHAYRGPDKNLRLDEYFSVLRTVLDYDSCRVFFAELLLL